MSDIADQLVDYYSGLFENHVPMPTKAKKDMTDEELVEHCLYYTEKRRRKREVARKEALTKRKV